MQSHYQINNTRLEKKLHFIPLIKKFFYKSKRKERLQVSRKKQKATSLISDLHFWIGSDGGGLGWIECASTEECLDMEMGSVEGVLGTVIDAVTSPCSGEGSP